MINTNETKEQKLNNTPIDELKNENEKLQHELEIANAKIKWYEEQFKLSAAKKYGKSSDKVDDSQISFFNEAEVTQKPEAKEPTLEKITYERSKKRGINKASFEDLEVETIEYSIPEDQCFCETCNSKIQQMSTEIRKELKIVPAKVSIVHHDRNLQAKYG